MAEKPPAKCSTCGTVTSSTCSRCKTAKYCSTKCQEEDWPKHEQMCCEELEKVLERIADIIQTAYLKFRELTWDANVTEIRVKTDEIITHDGPLTPELFPKFPDHLIPNKSVKQGVLCHLVCQDPFAFMKGLISELLQGWPIQMSEVQVSMKNIPRKSTAILYDGNVQSNHPSFFHHLLQLKQTYGSKIWYVDISGAQYGLHRALWDAKDFNRLYVKSTVATCAFGENETCIRKIAYEQEGRASLLFRKCFEAASRMNQAIDNWKEQQDMSLASLVKLDGQVFEVKKTDLLAAMGLVVRDYISQTDFSEELRLVEASKQKPIVHHHFFL